MMRFLGFSPVMRAVGLVFTLGFCTYSHAQTNSDPALLPKNAFIWNQEERELGFGHFDEVFGGHDVPNGDKVGVLPQGPPIVSFTDGGEKEEALESFIREQKVAGLLILQNGMIRLEHYALGHSEAGRWTSQSVAKSVTSTLVGVAIKDGYIKSVDDSITDYIPELRGSAYDQVTIHQLLTMSTGVKWTESAADPNSDLLKFFAVPVDSGVDHTVSYMRRLPSEAEPGLKWVYKTGETHLLGVLVSSATGQSLSEYLSSKIWIPYGMEGKATWTLNLTDSEMAGCCLQMKLRDFARFGQFVLEDGHIHGESIVPDGWFRTATQTHYQVWGALGYGYQWWTYADGTFQALGIHGQMIHIDPARQLVVVINSAWPEAENNIRRAAASRFLWAVTKEIDNEK